MKYRNKSIIISMAAILLPLIITSATFSSELSAVELLKKAYINQRLVAHTGRLKTVVFLREKPPMNRKRPPRMEIEVPPHGTKPMFGKANSSIVEIRQKDGKMRMDYKSGHIAGLSIIDDGKKIMRIDRRNKIVVISPIPFSHSDISLLLSNYEVISKGTEDIANRPTRILQIKPRHAGNPSKKLWIDTETFMPLKREYYNSDGVLTTRSFYTEINYDAQIKDSDFLPPKDWQIIEAPKNMCKLSKKQISKIVEFDIVEPKYVPAGYVLDGFYHLPPPPTPPINPPPRVKGVHIRYVDGLNSISVFEVLSPPFRDRMDRMREFFRRPRMDHRMQEKPHRERLGNRQGRMIRMRKDDLNIIIIGDIAEAELQKIANSF